MKSKKLQVNYRIEDTIYYIETTGPIGKDNIYFLWEEFYKRGIIQKRIYYQEGIFKIRRMVDWLKRHYYKTKKPKGKVVLDFSRATFKDIAVPAFFIEVHESFQHKSFRDSLEFIIDRREIPIVGIDGISRNSLDYGKEPLQNNEPVDYPLDKLREIMRDHISIKKL